MNALFLDLRQALRALRQRPGFAAVVIATMALGIGTNVAIFTYLSYFLWPTVEAPAPERLAWLYTSRAEVPAGSSSYLDWRDLAQQGQTFSQVAAYRVFGASLKTDERTLFAWGHAVSGDYFAVFGATAHLGRLLVPADDRPEAERVLVLEHGFWQRNLGGDPSVVGRTVELDGRLRYTVVGVTRPRFQGQGFATSIYVPLANAGAVVSGLEDRRARAFSAIVRLRSGVTLAQASAAASALAAGLDEQFPEEEPRRFTLKPVTDFNEGLAGDPLVDGARVLMTAVALLLLLACANVANLLLARTTARRRELAVHLALGAPRWRLARRLFVESLLLATAGGVLGLGVARTIVAVLERYLLKTVPVNMGDWGESSHVFADPWRVALFFVAACVGSALLFGAAPAAAAARAELVTALKSDTAADRPGRRWKPRQLLVVAQVALAAALLLGAGLLVRTLGQLRAADPGFDVRGLMLAALYVPSERTSDEAAGKAVYEELLARVRTLPGVTAATLAQRVPLSAGGARVAIELPGAEEPIAVDGNVVAPGFFATLGVARLEGRDFSERDRGDAPPVVVVNRAAAERFWPGRSPVGQRLTVQARGTQPAAVYEVVGVVADSHVGPLDQPVAPLFYFSYAQRFFARLTLLIRADAPLAGELQQLLRRDFPDLAVINLVPFSEQLRRSLANQRLNAHLAGGFGVCGLLLASLGIFSVLSYTVTLRTRELGIRQALGARRRDLQRLILGEAARLAGLGLLLGLAAAWALTRLLDAVLYGVSPRDPLTFLAVPLLLAAVALLAATLPARRAARTDPLTALRRE